jgi:hypothetical protein
MNVMISHLHLHLHFQLYITQGYELVSSPPQPRKSQSSLGGPCVERGEGGARRDAAFLQPERTVKYEL